MEWTNTHGARRDWLPVVDGNGLLANRSRSLLLFGWADLWYLSFIHTLLLSIGMGHWAWELIILRLSSVITCPLHATVHYLVVICLCSVEEKVFSENRIKTVCIFLKQTSNIRSLQKLTHPHTNTHTHQKVLKQVHRITYLVSIMVASIIKSLLNCSLLTMACFLTPSPLCPCVGTYRAVS